MSCYQAQEADGNLEKKKLELEHQLGMLMNARFKKVMQLKVTITQWTAVALSRAGPILNKTQVSHCSIAIGISFSLGP